MRRTIAFVLARRPLGFALTLDYFWPQNYITDPATGVIEYDDMIVATARVGCLQ